MRKSIIVGYCVAVIAVVLVVPWKADIRHGFTNVQRDFGYAFVLNRPAPAAKIDYGLIMLELIVITAATGLLFLIASPGRTANLSRMSAPKIDSGDHPPPIPDNVVETLNTKKWNVYHKGGAEPEIVKDGFNWWAFLFVGLWALVRGLTMAGIVGIAITVTLNRMPSEADIVAIPAMLVLMLLYGFLGNSWICAKLERSGYKLVRTIEADSKAEASAKFSAVGAQPATTSDPDPQPPTADASAPR